MMNFDIEDADFDLITKISDYAWKFYGEGETKMTVVMDLTACHANGMPLDLARMLDHARRETFDFAHDISGIRRHINRETGKMQDCFVPRFARCNHV